MNRLCLIVAIAWSMSLSATPSAASSARQAVASASVMSALKRACTMPIRKPIPSSGVSAPLFAFSMSVFGDVAGDLQAVARRHARHATRVGIDHRVPAVVIVHGSDGVDSRGSLYAADLNDAGIATLEIDMWAARGIRGPEGRPKGVPETLPDAYGAFKLLAAHPAIDPDRIGIMGFSWGGVVSMLTASRIYTERYLGKGARFAAHAPNYPVCSVYNRVPGYEMKELTGAPILLQTGTLDD